MLPSGSPARFGAAASSLPTAGVVFALALACGCATTAAETAAGTWYEVRSPRFQLWTDGDPSEARDLVLDLEYFHQVMLAKTTAEERTAAPPLRIFLAKDRESLAAWTGAAQNVYGQFRATYRGNYALVQSQGDGVRGEDVDPLQATTRHFLFHEYTHYMLAAEGARVPSWYNEGFAEYMAATEFRDDGSYTLGCPPRYRTRWTKYLQWLPIGRVMESENVAKLVRGDSIVRSYREASDAYAQSWYTVHYFSADDGRKKQLLDYLKLWESGTDGEQAAQSAFGMDYTELDGVLRTYAQQPKLPCVEIEPARGLRRARIDVRPLSRAEAHYHVGDLLLSVSGPTDTTLTVLQQAAKLEPRDAKALAALARAHWLRAQSAPTGESGPALQEADRHIARARELASADPEILVVEAHIRRLSAQQLKGRDDAAAAEQLKLARGAYRKAIRADETLGEAYYGLGLTYLIEDTGSKEPEVVLEAAAYLLPLDPDVALAFAQLHIQRGNALTAVPALEYVLRWSNSEEIRAQVKEQIAELQAAAGAEPAERAAQPAAAHGAEPDAPTQSAPQDARGPGKRAAR